MCVFAFLFQSIRFFGCSFWWLKLLAPQLENRRCCVEAAWPRAPLTWGFPQACCDHASSVSDCVYVFILNFSQLHKVSSISKVFNSTPAVLDFSSEQTGFTFFFFLGREMNFQKEVAECRMWKYLFPTWFRQLLGCVLLRSEISSLLLHYWSYCRKSCWKVIVVFHIKMSGIHWTVAVGLIVGRDYMILS